MTDTKTRATKVVYATSDQSDFDEWVRVHPEALLEDTPVISPPGKLLAHLAEQMEGGRTAIAMINIVDLDVRLVTYLDDHSAERFCAVACRELEVMAMLATDNRYFAVDMALIGTSKGSVSRCIVRLRRTR